jgi:ATP-dependent RNA helicase RhlB
VICDSTQELQVMLGLMRDHQPVCSVVFANTKIVAEWLQYKLSGNGIECDLITGDLPQKKRIALIQKIKEGKVKALIATDVASRGLHISGITHVYNFDLPDEAANYVHRIGRTARAGASGSAYSLVCEDYGHNLIDIEKYLGENVKIKTEWFPESYLQIEDKAGNPYKDPEFKGSRMNDKEERRDGRRGGGDRSKRPDRGQKPGASAQGEKPKHERKPSGGPRIEARQDRGGAEGKDRQEQQPKGQKGKRQDVRQQPAAAAAAGTPTHPRGGNRHRKAHTNQPTQTIQPRGKTIIKPVQPEVVPNSFLGIFKKIFAIFFGKRK